MLRDLSIRRKLILSAVGIATAVMLACAAAFVALDHLLASRGPGDAVLGALALLTGLVIAVVLGARLQGAFAERIVHLRDIARRVARERDYSIRASEGEGRGDELDELTREFNEMLEFIEHRDAILEQEVQERTDELMRLNERLKHQAYHDTLTRLPNRALFDDRLTLGLAQAERYGTKLAVLFLDLNDFKNINDTLGHEYGDQILRMAGERLQGAVRANDTVARLGGDEFTVIATQLDSAEDAARVAGTVLGALAEPYELDGQSLQVTASVGISVYPFDGATVSALKRHADMAMYYAKETGSGATYQFFSAELQEKMRRRHLMLTELDRAVRDGELQTLYQARVAPGGAVVAAEARVLWRHPRQGIIGTGELERYAGEAGLASRLDRWLLRAVVAERARWAGAGRALMLGVPLSLQSLVDENTPEFVRDLLLEHDAAPEGLEVEIRGDALARGGGRLHARIAALKEVGVRLAIGGFGTGHTALRNLVEFPVDAIKLGHEYTRALPEDDGATAIARGITSMAHSLGIEIVAEGVERPEGHQVLMDAGCSYFSGPLYQDPLEASVFAGLAAAGPQAHVGWLEAGEQPG